MYHQKSKDEGDALQEKRRRRRFSWLATGAVIVAIIILIVLDEQAQMQSQPAPAPVPAMAVSYTQVRAATYTAVVKTMAEVNPRFQSSLRSQVSGHVVELAEAFLAGAVVKSGDLLLRIENSSYRAAVASAENNLAQARLAYLTEERQALQAKRNWQRSGIDAAPDSPLTLHEPQLQAARTQLKAAEAELQRAQVELARTEIRAPFNGVIVERTINPGETVDPGQALGNMLATETLDITVKLSERQWNLLSENWRDANASVLDQVSGITASARIRDSGKYIDPKTRLRRLYLEIKTQTTTERDNNQLPNDQLSNGQLLAGSYVQVSLPGRAIPGIYRVPESSYTREARIWYLDKNDRLANFQAHLLFTLEDYVYVTPAEPIEASLRVVLYPQGSFNQGQKVTAQLASNLLAGGD